MEKEIAMEVVSLFSVHFAMEQADQSTELTWHTLHFCMINW